MTQIDVSELVGIDLSPESIIDYLEKRRVDSLNSNKQKESKPTKPIEPIVKEVMTNQSNIVRQIVHSKIINLDKDLLRGSKPFDLKFPNDFKYDNEDTFDAPSTGNIHKVWVAGGAIRNWLMNEKNIDIDVFFNSRDALNIFKNLNLISDSPSYVSNYCEAYNKNGQHIQLITKFFDNIKDMFDYFDYTLCQFAFDGQDLYTTEYALKNTTNKQLCVNNIQQNCELSSLNRAFKYASYGYNVDVNTLRNIATSFIGLDIKDIKEQHIEYPDSECNVGIIKI